MAHEKFPSAPTFTSQDRLLVLAPHCDDETLGVGGTIAGARAKGAAVRIVFLTNGDSSLSTKIAEDARWLRRNSFRQLVATRQHEAVAAMKALGVAEQDVTFLGYPDGGTKAMWETNWSTNNLYRSPATGANHTPYANSRTPDAAYCGEQALRDVREVIEEFQPTAIFTTHPSDTHPDHWAAYAYANTALQTLRLQPSTQAWAGRIQLLTFLVHRGPWPAPHGYHPDAALSPPAALKDVGTHWVQMPLDDHARAAKKAALECYVSQLAFTPQYLRGFLRRNELLGVVPAATLSVDTPKPLETGAGALQPPPLVRDPSRDSLLHDVWPSADLKSITVARADDGHNLRLRVKLARTPSARLSYIISLHVLSTVANETSTADAASVDAVTLIVSQGASGLKAILRRGGVPSASTSLDVRRIGDGFEVALPETAFAVKHPRTLFISASTHLGRTSFDQTELGTLRLVAPAPEAPKRTTVVASISRLPHAARRQ
jgi:LmbE family N-acetylglucosaminyl deacetylase